MNLRTVKSVAALALTGTASVLVMGFRTSSSSVSTTTAITTVGTAGSSSTSTAGAVPTATTSATGTGDATAAAAGATYADGTWTGAAVREPWGTFEVQAVVTDGQITDVVLVASPTDGHSSRINARAVPKLTASAIAAQSADVDMVSGATWTSQSYTTSLQAALDDAKAAA